MKLIYAVISNDDSDNVITELNKSGYQATKLCSSGGFLKIENVTLMIGTGDDNMSDVIRIIKNVCGERRDIEINVPCVTPPFGIHTLSYATIPQTVEVGGAIIFAVDVDYYEKI